MFNIQSIGGGLVDARANEYQLQLPVIQHGYANAQIDDYAGTRRSHYPHRQPIVLSLQAKFSSGDIVGTAGFGFWNAPYGDPTHRFPTFPKAVWFFYAASPNHLPFLHGQTGWFAATIDVSGWQTLLAPIALFNWLPKIQPHLWPRLTRLLGIRMARVPADATTWHYYQLKWVPRQTTFSVDGRLLLATEVSPKSPLGFVAWIDNQYLIATPKGRFGAGTVATEFPQALHLRDVLFHS